MSRGQAKAGIVDAFAGAEQTSPSMILVSGAGRATEPGYFGPMSEATSDPARRSSSELLRDRAEELGIRAVDLRKKDATLDPVGLILDGSDPEARGVLEQIEGVSPQAIAEGRIVEAVVRRATALAILRDISPEAALALETPRMRYAIPMIAIGHDGVAIGRCEWGEVPDAPNLN